MRHHVCDLPVCTVELPGAPPPHLHTTVLYIIHLPSFTHPIILFSSTRPPTHHFNYLPMATLPTYTQSHLPPFSLLHLPIFHFSWLAPCVFTFLSPSAGSLHTHIDIFKCSISCLYIKRYLFTPFPASLPWHYIQQPQFTPTKHQVMKTGSTVSTGANHRTLPLRVTLGLI